MKIKELAEKLLLGDKFINKLSSTRRVFQPTQQAKFSPKIVYQDTDKSFLALVTAKIGICFIPPSM